MILDNMQIANIGLQMMYFVNYLHMHEQPRCMGPINLENIFWPMCIVLPYMGGHQNSLNEEKIDKIQ